MHGEREETVRRACTAWGEGDLDAIRRLYSPDVIADGGDLWPEGTGSVQGIEAVLENFSSLMSAFESSELIPEGFLEEGETVIVPLLWRGRLAGSAGFIEQRLTGAYRFRGIQIDEIRWYASVEQALEGLGLPPERMAALRPAGASAS